MPIVRHHYLHVHLDHQDDHIPRSTSSRELSSDDAFEDAAEPDEKEKLGEAAGEHHDDHEEGRHNRDEDKNHRDPDGDHEDDRKGHELGMTNEIYKYYDNPKFCSKIRHLS